MRRFFSALLFVLCMLLVTPARAEAPTPAEAAQWVEYYYLHKDPSLTRDVLKQYEASGMLDNDPDRAAALAGFLSVLFREHPESVKGWIAVYNADGGMRDTLQRALWLSGNEALIASATGTLPDYAKTPATPLADMRADDVASMHIIWGAFYATGDTAYFEKIIDAQDVCLPRADIDAQRTPLCIVITDVIAAKLARHELLQRATAHAIATRKSDAVVVLKVLQEKITQQPRRP